MSEIVFDTNASSYVETEFQDPQTPPTQDFYRHANGRWLDTHQIPADRSADGAFHQLAELSEKNQRDLVEGLDTTDSDPDKAKIAGVYRQFMDTDRVEELGLTPLVDDLALVDQASNHQELFVSMARLDRLGVPGLFGAGVSVDTNDTDRYCIFLTQAGLGLPDESFYREAQHQPIRDAYVSFLNSARQLLADDEGVQLPSWMGADFGQTVLEFETKVAANHWDRVSLRDQIASNNPCLLGEFNAKYTGLPWSQYWQVVSEYAQPDSPAIVRQPSFFAALPELWNDSDLDSLRAWLAAQILLSRSHLLNAAMVEVHFQFSRILTGADELRARWKRGLGMVETAMGEALGRLFVDAHFPPSYREQMEELVSHLLEAYRQSITNLPWMGEDTRQAALRKLGTFNPKIGYPKKWRSFDQLSLGDDLVATARKCAEFEHDFNWGRLAAGEVDRDEWLMTPQTVNAYYYPLLNEIVFPAAILRPPFFDPKAPMAVNYGAIGAVIGHEIGHGFDDQGSNFDEKGLLRNWWKDADREEFSARTARLIDQYSQFSPAQLDDSFRVNGELTIGENIGDLGGLTIAWKAYQHALAEQGVSSAHEDVHGDYTGAQLFFYAWARVWRQKSRDEWMRQLLVIDPHSPAEFRCNGVVKNCDAFHETFGTKPGDGMWLDPQQRVSIW
ncbi:MAG: M13-type metalloendopeptidase [Actinomycetaceae bacterium]|nr:M13-type metalloendopeptidase [Actinomycetaceae bacterium]